MMNEDRDREEEPFMDIWLASFEQQCYEHIENGPDYEGQVQSERDMANQRNWLSFQNTATAIAQLYRDRQQGVSLWVPFQTAAGTVTSLYKDSSEAIRRVSDVSIQCGYQRRNKELLNWARKRRRTIRREDLVAYLAGKPLPPRTHHHHRTSPRPRTSLSERHGSPHSASSDGLPMPIPLASPANRAPEDNLHIFREALTVTNPAVSFSRKCRSAELSSYIANEFARNGMKRQASSSPPHDVNMDSPTHKRSRLM